MYSQKQQEILDNFVSQSDVLFDLGVIRTDSFTGEIGEYVACQHFSLTRTQRSTRAVDAVDANGLRYQIKSKVTNSDKLNFNVGGIDAKVSRTGHSANCATRSAHRRSIFALYRLKRPASASHTALIIQKTL